MLYIRYIYYILRIRHISYIVHSGMVYISHVIDYIVIVILLLFTYYFYLNIIFSIAFSSICRYSSSISMLV